MASNTVKDIVNKVNKSLVDDEFTRWPKVDLLEYFNDAQMAIVLLRPDAFVFEASMLCVEGTKQTIPEDALRLVDITHNSASGMSIVRRNRSEIIEYDTSWYASSGSSEAEAFVYDERNPEKFFVYPGLLSGASIEIVYSKAPTPVLIEGIETESSVLDSIYTNAIIEYMLYSAHSKDFEYSEQQRANTHYQMFRTILNAKSEGEIGMTPTNKD